MVAMVAVLEESFSTDGPDTDRAIPLKGLFPEHDWINDHRLGKLLDRGLKPPVEWSRLCSMIAVSHSTRASIND
jgi:hypothetical protein